MAVEVGVLNKCSDCFKSARQDLILGAKYLYEISESKLWEGNYSSFGDFVEEECQISKSFAAKLVQLWGHYAIKGGVPHVRLMNIDSEKLYLATKLPGPPQVQLESAATLSRRELRAEQIYQETGAECVHQPITICSKCHARL